MVRESLDLQERERKLVAYEIHDGLAQQLAGALMKFQAFAGLRDQNSHQAKTIFDAGLQLLREGIDETRRLISGLRLPILDESGVVAAVDYLICELQRVGGPQIEFVHDVRFDRLAAPLETAVFRIIQESLTNACRHSQSEKVRVELTQRDDRVRIMVQDWGIGFDPAAVAEDRFGLQGIRARARLLGGRASVDSAPGEGTRISAELPLLQNRV